MGSTYLSLHYHVVFSTRERASIIDESWRDRLHRYLGGTVRGLGGIPEEIGGVADHVHLLMGLRATHVLADVMREMKKASSMWVHQQTGKTFAWQEGYAAFTVSAGNLDAVRHYIGNQAAHHERVSFRDELIAMLTRAGVEYDLRYLE